MVGSTPVETDDAAERARAHSTSLLMVLRERRLDEVEADLRRAEDLRPTPLSIRGLVAIARARRTA
jgi:hypothetical protein